MLPPIPPATLSANPQFASLFSHLTTSVLNPDASTRTTSRSHATLDQDLRTRRAELAKEQLLQRELEGITTASRGLPEELRDLLDLLTTPSTLPTPLHPSTLQQFHADLPTIGSEISENLLRHARSLTSLLHPEAEPDPQLLDAQIDLLPADAAHLRTNLHTAHASLISQRAALSNTILATADVYSAISTRALAHASTTLPTLQKSTLAKAAYLAVLSESMHGKVGVVRFDALGEVYDEEAVGALDNYRAHLTDTNLRLVARRRVVELELERYGAAGADMKGLVERYGGILRGIESVGKDIKRLGGKV